MAMIPVFLLAALPMPEAWRACEAYNAFFIGPGWWVAGAVFALAFATDALDGYVARSRNLVTDLGKFMDPLADKALVVAALFVMVERGWLSSWIAATIAARELAVTALRAIAAGKGVVLAADKFGKAKTILQFAGLSLMLFENFRAPALVNANAGFWVMVAALAATIASGASYIVRNREVFSA